MKNSKDICAIVLAAGKGTRMQLQDVNKVTLLLGGKPIIRYIVDLLTPLGLSQIIIVVGHAKQSVIASLKSLPVTFVEQKAQLGTANAVKSALKKIPNNITDVLVLHGDDSAFYTKDIISKLTLEHKDSKAAATLLTLSVNDPTGYGRIIRDNANSISEIIEEKEANSLQKNIQEINPGCYIFTLKFLKKYIGLIEKSNITGEYYLVDIIKIGKKYNEPIHSITLKDMHWKSINSKDELRKAEDLFLTLKQNKPTSIS